MDYLKENITLVLAHLKMDYSNENIMLVLPQFEC